MPFFYSGVSCLSMTSNYTDVPLLAFLIPFSYELWAAIFGSLLLTAIAAAIYEWFSPFGLNPWGRQRTKNFSLASALWVMCSLLFSHLVAFKAPKSWPNKVRKAICLCFCLNFIFVLGVDKCLGRVQRDFSGHLHRQHRRSFCRSLPCARSE